MLENLYIKNFILIDELNLAFNKDFSAFTGETGAGKSIFIDCISCLIGDKLTTAMIRKGADKTIIEGTFSVDCDTAKMLQEAGYDCESLIITREINIDGKSTTRVNQRTCTVSFIKDLLTNKVDIHNQHDNQYLLNEKYHLSLLDQYCQHQDLLNQLAGAYKEYDKLEKEYNELLNTTFNQAQIEMIQYQVNEIEKLGLKDIHEDDDIEAKLKLINDSQKVQESIEKVKELFNDNGILDKLYEFSKMSSSFDKFDNVKDNVSHIIDAYYTIQEDYDSIISKLDNLDYDEDSINELNQRLFDLQRVKRKYNTNLQGLIQLKDELQEQLDQVSNRDFILSKIEKQKQECLQQYNLIANKVSQSRKEKALQLEQEIMKECQDLSLVNAQFKILFEDMKPSSKGSDNVSFVVSMNKGQPLQPLAKVASGGELSRLMLALKTIFASLQGTNLIIFDEIDTGVSGYVALNIGAKMNRLGRKLQVFAVTHLPPVAACANSHYLIKKTQNEDSTNTKVLLLNDNENIEQLAILSSANVSETSLSAAKELYEKAQYLCGKYVC